MVDVSFGSSYRDTIWRDTITIPKLPVQEIWIYLNEWLDGINADYEDVKKFNYVVAEQGSRGGKSQVDAKKTIRVQMKSLDEESIIVVIEVEFNRLSKFGMKLLGDTFDAFDDSFGAKKYRGRWEKFCEPFLGKVRSVVNVIEKEETGGKPMHCPWCGLKIGFPWPRFCMECGNPLDGFNVPLKD